MVVSFQIVGKANGNYAISICSQTLLNYCIRVNKGCLVWHLEVISIKND